MAEVTEYMKIDILIDKIDGNTTTFAAPLGFLQLASIDAPRRTLHSLLNEMKGIIDHHRQRLSRIEEDMRLGEVANTIETRVSFHG